MKMKTDIDTLVADLQPVRPVEPRGGALLAIAAAAVAAAVVIAWQGLRPDIVAGNPHPMVMMREGMLLVLGFASLAAVVASARPGVGQSSGGWRWALAAASLFPLTSIALSLASGSVPEEDLYSANGPWCLGISLGSSVLIGAVLTLDERIGRTIAAPRFSAALLSVFAGLSVLLSAAGVFGVASYSVAARRREFGIRLAIGATRTRLLRLVLTEAAALASAAIGIGIVLSMLAGQVLTRILPGVGAPDPVLVATVAACIAVTTLAAGLSPARLATRADPLATLREE